MVRPDAFTMAEFDLEPSGKVIPTMERLNTDRDGAYPPGFDMLLKYVGYGEEANQRDRKTDTPLDMVQETLGWSEECASSSSPQERAAGRSVGLPAVSLPGSTTASPVFLQHPTQRQQKYCSECAQTFDTGDQLEIHAIEQQHPTFDCKVPGCDKKFYRRDTKHRHVQAHGSRHVCEICHARFARRDHLRRHERVQHLGSPGKSLQLSSVPKETRVVDDDVDIKKVKESEPALRRCLPADSLAIQMLDIFDKTRVETGSTEVGIRKAFAYAVASVALNASGTLSPRTVRRLSSIQHVPSTRVVNVGDS